MWWCFHELGAGDQFRLPDEELNSRISREGRRRAMSHRRRDNRECLERLEAAAQPPQSTTSAPLASPQAMVSTHLPDVILRDGHQSVASNYIIIHITASSYTIGAIEIVSSFDASDAQLASLGNTTPRSTWSCGATPSAPR